jgi:ribonuclease VapC
VSDFVVDTSAILAVIFQEPGRDRAARALEGQVLISAVNLSEAIAKLLDRGFSRQEATQEIANLRLETRSFGEADAAAAGFLRAITRQAGLSLGDRACIALGQELNLPVLTADRIWAGLDLGITLELIR